MSKHFFTFGQVHVHKVNGQVFDKDSVVQIEAEDSYKAREIMFEHFGDEWSMQYSLEPPKLEFFPRGIIPLFEEV